MQPRTAAPRGHLSDDQVKELVECDSLEVAAGLELLDLNDELVKTAGTNGDISNHLLDGIVQCANFADIHRTLRVSITTAVEWGSQRLRPYMVLTDKRSGVTARFNLGVYLPETPARNVGATPPTYVVEAYDKLVLLRRSLGRGYAATAGTLVLQLVADLIGEVGETKIRLDPSGVTATLPVDMVRPIDNTVTRLSIVNDLLASIGYRGLWVDWDGYYRSEPHQPPATSSPEWSYDVESESTTVEERLETQDLFDVPNVWVFVNTARAAASAPSEGDGLYTVTNPSNGPTSIDSRGGDPNGRRPTVVPLQAADQASLVVQGDRIAANDQQTTGVIEMSTGTNPLHWHFDVGTLADPDLPPSPRKCVWGRWALPLRGERMTHEMRTA